MNAINTLNFNSRESYKLWVAGWKQQHADLIKAIRQAKLDLKAVQRANEITWKAYSALNSLRRDINDSQELRYKSKVEANRQYLAERAQVTA